MLLPKANTFVQYFAIFIVTVTLKDRVIFNS